VGEGGPGGVRGKIAIVGVAARVAPGLSLDDVRRVLLGAPAPQPAEPKRWWGIPQSEWFRNEQGTAPRGHYFDEVSVVAGRFRIPPREIEEMLPQQALALAVAADAFDSVKVTPHPRPLSHKGQRGELRERTGAYVGVSLDLNTTNFHQRWALLKHDPDLADL